MRIPSILLASALISASLMIHASPASAVSVAFTAPGTYTWTVPEGITVVDVSVAGGGGAGGRGSVAVGGNGALVQTNFQVAPGQILNITVGGGGAHGGGGGGGGASSLEAGTADQIVAGGGGGGGGQGTSSGTGQGGNGGTPTGSQGASIVNSDGRTSQGGAGGGNGTGGSGGAGFAGVCAIVSGGAGGSGDGGEGGSSGGGGAGGASSGSGIGGDSASGRWTGAGGGGFGGGGAGGGGCESGGGDAGGGGGGSTGPMGSVFSLVANGGDAGMSGGNGFVSIEWLAGNNDATAPQVLALTLVQQDGTTCANDTVTGYAGTWITLPQAADCTPPATKPNAKLLGWATSPTFPIDIAKRQVDNGWGAYETFTTDGQLTSVFIPAGGATFVSAAGNIYPIWNE